ncbi:hypothetical protein Plhal703r1_c06g0035191 [Plasmopara halstedii]
MWTSNSDTNLIFRTPTHCTDCLYWFLYATSIGGIFGAKTKSVVTKHGFPSIYKYSPTVLEANNHDRRPATACAGRKTPDSSTCQAGIKLFQIQEWVGANFKINLSRSTTHRIIHALEDVFSSPQGHKKNRSVRFPEGVENSVFCI